MNTKTKVTPPEYTLEDLEIEEAKIRNAMSKTPKGSAEYKKLEAGLEKIETMRADLLKKKRGKADSRLNQVISRATGQAMDFAARLHLASGATASVLAAEGVNHKSKATDLPALIARMERLSASMKERRAALQNSASTISQAFGSIGQSAGVKSKTDRHETMEDKVKRAAGYVDSPFGLIKPSPFDPPREMTNAEKAAAGWEKTPFGYLKPLPEAMAQTAPVFVPGQGWVVKSAPMRLFK